MTRPFRHDGAATAAREWTLRAEWAEVPFWNPLGADRPDRVVVVAARPVDGSLGAGGVIAMVRAAAIPVTLVVATAGEPWDSRSPTLSATALADQRRNEAQRAWAALGGDADELILWDLSDGSLAEREKELTARLVEVVGDGRATLLLGPYLEDGHPDHDALGWSAQRAAYRTGATVLQYPVGLWHHADPDEVQWTQLRRVALTAFDRHAKEVAIACHRSQITPWSDRPRDETLLNPSLIEHLTGPYETFVLSSARDDALDDLHSKHDDPWGTATRWYEKRKRQLLLAMLPRPRFTRALDLGCSTGTLTVDLVARCDELVAVDSSPHALEAAATLTQGVSNVELRLGDLSTEVPEGDFDLVVLSEVGYFLSPVALDRLIARIARVLTPDGCLVVAHWRHPISGWPLSGPEVHARFAQAAGLPPVAGRYLDRDVEIVVHADETTLPNPYS